VLSGYWSLRTRDAMRGTDFAYEIHSSRRSRDKICLTAIFLLEGRKQVVPSLLLYLQSIFRVNVLQCGGSGNFHLPRSDGLNGRVLGKVWSRLRASPLQHAEFSISANIVIYVNTFY